MRKPYRAFDFPDGWILRRRSNCICNQSFRLICYNCKSCIQPSRLIFPFCIGKKTGARLITLFHQFFEFFPTKFPFVIPKRKAMGFSRFILEFNQCCKFIFQEVCSAEKNNQTINLNSIANYPNISAAV